jgi:hypothetical protein
MNDDPGTIQLDSSSLSDAGSHPIKRKSKTGTALSNNNFLNALNDRVLPCNDLVESEEDDNPFKEPEKEPLPKQQRPVTAVSQLWDIKRFPEEPQKQAATDLKNSTAAEKRAKAAEDISTVSTHSLNDSGGYVQQYAATDLADSIGAEKSSKAAEDSTASRHSLNDSGRGAPSKPTPSKCDQLIQNSGTEMAECKPWPPICSITRALK